MTPVEVTYRVTYQDGSTETIQVTLPSWSIDPRPYVREILGDRFEQVKRYRVITT